MTSRLPADESKMIDPHMPGVTGQITSDESVSAKTVFSESETQHKNADGSELTPPGCPYKIKSIRPIFQGRWMGARQVDFSDSRGDGCWQVAYRTSKLQHNNVDGLLVIPIIKFNGGQDTSIVLIKQFRIPIMSWCLEFPAGLLDPGETVEQCAFRELKEETGYTAKSLIRLSKITALDPGLVDATANVAIVEIDGDAAENMNPVQTLKHGEPVIDTVIVKDSELMSFIEEANSKEQVCVEMSLWTFAAGYDMARALGHV